MVAANAADAPGTPVPFTTGRAAPGGLGLEAGVALSRVPGHEGGLWRAAALRLPGRHNLANAIAASGVAMALGAHPAGMARAVAAFRAGPHRLAAVGEVRGVAFVNDSKATNPHAAARALAAFPRVVWIAGGRNKGLDFDDLVAGAARRLVGVVLVGEAAEELMDALGRAGYPGPGGAGGLGRRGRHRRLRPGRRGRHRPARPGLRQPGPVRRLRRAGRGLRGRRRPPRRTPSR